MMKGLAFPKPRPRVLDKRETKAERAQIDDAQNKHVKARSGGICEVCVKAESGAWRRCMRMAFDIHHLIGGSGRRGYGTSQLASHKLHVCRKCHADITRHVLVPVGVNREWAANVVYERVR